MILAALASPFVALAIFIGTLFAPKRRATTKAEREAASARLVDGPRAAKTVVLVVVTAWSLLVIAAIHLLAARTAWMPGVLS